MGQYTRPGTKGFAVPGQVMYYFLLQQHRGVTIENCRALKEGQVFSIQTLGKSQQDAIHFL